MFKFIGFFLCSGLALLSAESKCASKCQTRCAPAQTVTQKANDCGFFVSKIEALYWKIQSDLPYADKYKSFNNTQWAQNITKQFPATTESLKMPGAAGIRLGFGYQKKNCDILANYTYFSSKTDATCNSAAYPVLFWEQFFASDFQNGWYMSLFTNQSKASWKVDLQNVDFTYGKFIYKNKGNIIKAYAGGKFANIKQTIQAQYTGTTAGWNSTAVIDYQSKFSAPGGVVGIFTGCELRPKLLGFIQAESAYLIGHFDVSHTQSVTYQGAAPYQNPTFIPNDYIDYQEKPVRGCHAHRCAVGFNWEGSAKNTQFVLGLTGEAQVWSNQNQMSKFTAHGFPVRVKTEDSLTIMGIVAKLSIAL